MPTHITINPSVLYFGTPVVLVVTRNPDGNDNISPMSSAWALDRSIVLGLGSAGQGAINLLRTGECTLNIPNALLWPNVERIARATGASPVPAYKTAMGYRHERDKFGLAELTSQPAECVQTSRIAECPLQFEARLAACHKSALSEPDEIDATLLVEVEVLRVHAHPDIVIDGTSYINTGAWNPLLYVFRHYFGHAVDLGRNFRCEA